MDRSVRLQVILIASFAFSVATGCEYKDISKPEYLAVSGTVTYNGNPVKMGAIQFLPVGTGLVPATGEIEDGEIKNVTTHELGDGIMAGRYKISVNAFDQAFKDEAAKRDHHGADPSVVTREAARVSKLIPARYGNYQSSGLTAEISPTNRTLKLELVD